MPFPKKGGEKSLSSKHFSILFFVFLIAASSFITYQFPFFPSDFHLPLAIVDSLLFIIPSILCRLTLCISFNRENQIPPPLKSNPKAKPSQTFYRISCHQPSPFLFFPVKPHLLSDPEDMTVTTGQNVKMVCNVSGDPEPQIIWRREDGNLPPERSVQDKNSFAISQVVPQDEGVYICEAHNIVGTLTVSASLSVHGML